MANTTTIGKFFHLKVSGLARKHEDDLTLLCFEHGASGVAEDLAFVQRDLRYDPDVIESQVVALNVFFETSPDETALLKIQREFPEAKFELLIEANRDWLAEWKKGFVPFLFAEPFWVVPSWLMPPPEAPKDPAHIIFVEPGMAFGTGTHETTRLAAGYVIQEMKRKPAQSVLDVGCGTGILALVAHRLGASQIVGIDNDPEARRTARENLELNHDTLVKIPEINIDEVFDQYDIVIANIIDGVLTLLRHELDRCLKPGGRMILSGVLTDRESEFYENFTRETGLELLEKRALGEWSAAILEKRI